MTLCFVVISLLEEDIFYDIIMNLLCIVTIDIRLYMDILDTLLVLHIYFGIEDIDKFKSYNTNKLQLKTSID
jgi:hypothetical protein